MICLSSSLTMNALPSPSPTCRICGSGHIAELQAGCHYRSREYSALLCQDCGCLFHNLDMSSGFEYADNYHAYNPFRWLSPKTFSLGKRTVKICVQAGLSRGILLDVGCGAGHV